MNRFSEPRDPDFDAINRSLDVDRRLWPYDIAQSRAHVAMLAAQGIISAEDAGKIHDALTRRPGSLVNTLNGVAALRAAGMDKLSILIVSAEVHALTTRGGQAIFHDDYLIKPFEVNQLLQRLETLLNLEWTYEAHTLSDTPAPRARSGGTRPDFRRTTAAADRT